MRKLRATVFCLTVLALSNPAHALTILGTVGSANESLIVGEVFVPGDLTGGQAVRDAAAVNGLVGATCVDCYYGTSPTYYRDDNFGVGALSTTDATGALTTGFTQSGDSAFLTLTKSYTYLVATYDGPNGGAIVWNISGIAVGETLQFARYARPLGTVAGDDLHMVATAGDGAKYQITHVTGLTPNGVPDGGVTAVLLGLSMLGLGYARRRKD